MVFENIAALYIAIEKQCTPEVAFKHLDYFIDHGKFVKQIFDWTEDDIKDVIQFKKDGLTLKEIGEYYGLSLNSIHHVIKTKTNYRRN